MVQGGLMSTDIDRLKLRIVERCAVEQPMQMLAMVKNILMEEKCKSMVPKDRRDWRAIDIKMAAVHALSMRADDEYHEMVLEQLKTPIESFIESIYGAATY